MWRVLSYLLLLGIACAGAIWLADHPETVAMTWRGRQYEVSLAVALVGVLVLTIVLSSVWAAIRFLFRLPADLGRGSRRRRHAKGLTALSRGIISVGAGDVAAARRYAGEAERLLGHEPLALLLKAQAAQASGDRSGAEAAFRRMTDVSETRVLGLRGLFLEARRRGDGTEARHYAEEAARIAPAVAWANDAVLEGYSADGDWAAAIRTVERRSSLGLIDSATSRRQRAVLYTADAIAREDADPARALSAVLEAVRLAPDLPPAAALAARLLGRRGELKRAAKIVETAWRAVHHPDLAAAYLNLRPGDSAADRLRRAETLARLSSWASEARLAIARAAVEARELGRARDALRPLAEGRPTLRTCLLMADIEEADGNTGRVREWLARAPHAPRDKAWIADGIVSERWAPVSPVTGRLDAFEWADPPELIGGPADSVLPEMPAAPAIAGPGAALPPLAPAASASSPLTEAETPSGAAVAPSPPSAASAGSHPEAGPEILLPGSGEPTRNAQPDATDPGRGPRQDKGAAVSRTRAPVVFPVPHAPDDPGADAEADRRSRFRLIG